ncbi:SCP2 sterol-binding domain-containing protein [Bacillus carboniphilus]|uniref:SCP2 sterol-binding domain-containing protein n=1 Tax=Bacillus carboniphilus TaxID=86663 RepID=A0ABY9JXT8_9BACI|nr:SCP2 sterol-binding domain-containing protein [Bacillus carboniphilus]WLR44197.1 SCP2 sterol-binding domain-containing protein [Bacillus carboniphilus]
MSAIIQELEQLTNNINQNPKFIENFEKTYQFSIKDEGVYSVAFSDNCVSYQEGDTESPACTIKCSSDNFIKLIKGKLNTTTAFMMGKIKVDGDISSALKLQSIIQKYQ